jgi:peptide/nickel transport system substrate-binding protein
MNDQPLIKEDRQMKKGVDRREFLKLGAAGLGALYGAGSFGLNAFAAKDHPVLRIGLRKEPQQLNPVRDTEVNAYMVNDLIYDGLFTRNAENKRAHKLATAWKWLDPKSVRFTLREGLKFHDGSPVDAEAYKWCLGYWQNKQSPFAREYRGYSINVVDKLNFDVVSPRPNALLLDRMIRFVVPKSVLTKVSEEEFAVNPVGCGPYTFEKWVKGDRITLNRWNDYYGRKGAFKKAEYRFIPEESVRLSALLNNEIDVMPQVPSFLAPQLEKNKDTYVKVARTPQLHLLCLKVIDPSPLKDLRLRQALTYAINVDEIIEQVFSGFAERATQPALPVFFGNDPNIKPIPHNPEKAKQLLKAAGYGNGLSLVMDTSTRYRVQSEAIVGYLNDVGIKVKLNVLEDASYNVIRRRGGQPNDILYVEFGHSVLDDIGVMIGLTSKMPFNTTGYKNPDFDKTYFASAGTIDKDERLKMAYKLAEISMRDLPWFPLYSTKAIWGLRKNILFEPGPLVKHAGLNTIEPI